MENINKKIDIIKLASEEKQGIDLKVIDIRKSSQIAEYFVIVSGNNSIQVKTIADEIDKKMYEEDFILAHKEGHQEGRWILLDYLDVVVHVFHKEDREYYNLERLWEEIDNN